MKIIHEGNFSTFSIYLTINGRLPSFDLITKEIGMSPILTGRVKEKIRDLNPNNDFLYDVWGVGFEGKPFPCLSEAMEVLIGNVSGAIEKFKRLKIRGGFELSVDAEVVVKDYVPLLDLTAEVMAWMVDLGANFSIEVFDPEHNLN